VVLDAYVATRALEIRSPTFGDLELYLPSQYSTRSCAFAMIELPLKKIPVVCEYADVFPDELPGMPLDRDIEFAIELCRRFEIGGVPKPTSECAACPSPDGSSAWASAKGGEARWPESSVREVEVPRPSCSSRA
jgi:hypothetical protein